MNTQTLKNTNALLYFLLITEIIFNGHLFTTGAPSLIRTKPHLITPFDWQIGDQKEIHMISATTYVQNWNVPGAFVPTKQDF